MAKRQDIPDILGQLRQPVNVLDDVLSGKPLGTFPKEVDYPIDRIIVGKRLRPVKDVTELAASMAESGLLQRIVLLPDGTLVVGGHRVAAAKQLGWTTIPARIAELDEVDAELAEIDENLYRRELTVLEQAEHLQRRMELLEIKGQRAKAGDNQHSETVTTAAVADSIGISERSAQQRLQIARGLSQQARDVLRDTELAQSTTKLLELAKQPQEYQVKIVEKMVNDGYQSVEMAALAVMPRKPAVVKDISYDAWCRQTDKRCTCDGLLFLSMHREDKDPAGVIKSARLDCYCSTCNGTQTWQANQEKGWYLVRSTTEHPVPTPAAEEPPVDDYPAIAMVEDPAPVRVVVDAELFGVACDAVSAAELGHNKIRKPFLYNNAMWTCVGTMYGGINHPEHNEADCLRLHVLGEPIAPGERITRYLESAYQAGTIVKCGGFTYVLGAQWMLVRTIAKDSAPAAQRQPATVLNGGRIVPGRAYQSIDQLTEEVRSCARQHYIEPHERARAAYDMNACAGARTGGFWKFVTTLTANYTQMDLVNAIHKVADEIMAGTYVWDQNAQPVDPAPAEAPAGTDDEEEEQPLKLATVADDDAALDILAPDRKELSSAAQQRNERIDRVTMALTAALTAANDFEDVTGAYTLTPALRRAIEPMLKALEGNRV